MLQTPREALQRVVAAREAVQDGAADLADAILQDLELDLLEIVGISEHVAYSLEHAPPGLKRLLALGVEQAKAAAGPPPPPLPPHLRAQR